MTLIDRITSDTSNVDIITLYSDPHPIKVLAKSLKRDSRGISYRIVVECEGLAPRFMCIKITKDRRGQSQVEGTVKKTSQGQAKRACGFEKAIQKEKKVELQKVDEKEKKVELQKVDEKEKKVDEKEKKVELQKVDEKEKKVELQKVDEKEKKVELQKIDEMEKKVDEKEKKVELQKLHDKEKKDDLHKVYQKENDNVNYGNHYGH